MTSYTEVLYSTTAHGIRRHLIDQSKRMFYQAISLRWDRWHERKISNTFQTSMYTVAFTSNCQRILLSANLVPPNELNSARVQFLQTPSTSTCSLLVPLAMCIILLFRIDSLLELLHVSRINLLQILQLHIFISLYFAK